MPLKKVLNMICVTFQKAGFHRYPAAPDAVAYLRAEHRHLFKFKVSLEVFHEDREVEFVAQTTISYCVSFFRRLRCGLQRIKSDWLRRSSHTPKYMALVG